MRSWALVWMLALAVSGACSRSGAALLTPEQARTSIATLMGVPEEQVTGVVLVPVPHRAGDYRATLATGGHVGVDAEDGSLTLCVLSRQDELTWNLTCEQAINAARQFCVAKGIPIPADYAVEKVFALGEDDSPLKTYHIVFRPYQGDVALPSCCVVRLGGASGAVFSLSRQVEPLLISIDPPYLTAAQAGEISMACVQQLYPDATNFTEAARAIFADWDGEVQRLQWLVAISFESAEGDADQADVCLDARTGEVLWASSPAGPLLPLSAKGRAPGRRPMAKPARPAVRQPQPLLRRFEHRTWPAMHWNRMQSSARG